DSTKEVGERVVDMSIDNDGELTEIDLDETYLVTTVNFRSQSGDGIETFSKCYEEGRVKDIGEIDWEQLRDYMVEEDYLNGIADPEREDRIVDLKGESDDISAADMKELVDQLEDSGAFANSQSARALTLHLTAVSHYDESGKGDNVVKEMGGFKLRLDQREEDEVISEQAYNKRKANTGDLIKKRHGNLEDGVCKKIPPVPSTS